MEIYFITTSYSSQIYFIITSWSMDGYDVEFWTLLNGPYSAYNFLKMVQCEHNISVLFPVNHCVLIRRQQQQLWISCMKHFFKKKIVFHLILNNTKPLLSLQGMDQGMWLEGTSWGDCGTTRLKTVPQSAPQNHTPISSPGGEER